jgi:ribosomal protein L40E/thioredoxin-like negative regulator of GroEL
MRMRLGKDDKQDVTIASVGPTMGESDSYIVVCLCPKCGEFIDENIETCQKCDAVLIKKANADENISSDVLETKDSIFLCSGCGAFIGEEHTHCLACGIERPPIPAEFGATGYTSFSDETLRGYADSLLETTPSLFICNKCGAFLSPNASKCGICGTDASENMRNESTQNPGMIGTKNQEFFSDVLSSEGEISICGSCGAFMSPDSDSCSMCGVEKTVMLVCEEIEVEVITEEDENPSSSSLLMCDECGAFVSSHADFCTSCGIEMSIDEPYEEEPVTEANVESVLESLDNVVVLEKMNTKALEQSNVITSVKSSVESEEEKIRIVKKWLTKKARALIKLGRYSEAIDSLNHALESDPDDVEILTEKAHIFYFINRYEEAAELYKKILEVQPRNISLWNKLGNALFRLNHTKESQICYEKALSLDSNNSETIINQGYLFLKQRKYDEAMGYARRMAA